MAKFTVLVEVTETRQMTIEAESREEAIDMVDAMTGSQMEEKTRVIMYDWDSRVMEVE